MNRRIFITSLACLPFSSKTFAAQTWRAKFVTGQFDGTYYQMGLHVSLDQGWKTYWRNPGEAGVPPAITAEAANFDSLRVDFPLPTRFKDESGEAIGFHDEVLFPIYLKPRNPSQPVITKLSAFFGVCDKVCIPATVDREITFSSQTVADNAVLLSRWQSKVPKQAPIVSANKIIDGHLVLDLTQKFDDLFIEGPDRFYFRKPDFARQSGKAWIKIDGLKKSDDLLNVDLRATAAAAGQGLEQHFTVA